jgi:hypothetical protein
MVIFRSYIGLMTMPTKWIYQVSMVFELYSIFIIFFFYVGDDLRTSSFDERGNDAIQAIPRDPLEVLVGLVTELKAKRFK